MFIQSDHIRKHGILEGFEKRTYVSRFPLKVSSKENRTFVY